MSCYSQEDLLGYLLQELAAAAQAGVEHHVNSCTACCQTLEALANDDLVRDYFEASRRDVGNDEETARTGASTTVRITARLESVAVEELPDWQPFTADASQLPLRFGKFVLKEALGSGGFGVVYRAVDVDLEREVAVKIPHLGGLSPEVRQRFLQEGTAAANLHHPHIVQVHQSGTYRGVCFLVSEYCPGRTLRQLLDESDGVRSVEEAARIVLLLAEAVRHAHQNGIVHRDIKPANVILDSRSSADGLPYCPKLTDFGTARLVGTDQSLTASGMLVGTAPYMAPEQVSGSGEVGQPCDVYALGVLLYELLAGHLPIQGSDNADTICQVVSCEPVPLHRLNPRIRRDISAICRCCLEKRPERRYGTATELAADLRRFLNGEQTVVRPLAPAARIIRWSQRNPLPLTIMGTICVVFVLVVTGLTWHTRRLRDLNGRLATSNRRANELKTRAEQSELHAQQMRYASDMRLAEKSWREHDVSSVRDILARYEPAPGERDLRGIEWYFLRQKNQPSAVTVTPIGSAAYCLRISPDQQLFATGGQDGVIRLHERATGILRQSIASGQGEVNSVAFSPDGQTVASAGDDGSVRVWRIADGKQLERYAAHDGMAFGAEFTPDAQYLVTCGTDGFVRLWKGGKAEASHQDHMSRVEAIAVSPDGRWLASVGKDRTLVVRDVHTGDLQLRWDQAHGTLSSVAFSPDSKTVAVVEVSGETKWLRLFDHDSGSEILSRQHADGIRAVAYSPEGDRVLTADNVGTVRTWNVSTPQAMPPASANPLETWQAHNSRVYAGVFEPDGMSILAVGEDGRVQRLNATEDAHPWVVDRNGLAAQAELDVSNFALHSVTFHPNGRDILAAAHVGIATRKAGANHDVQFQQLSGNHFWEHVATTRQGDWTAVAGSTSSLQTNAGIRTPAQVLRWDAAGETWRTLFETQPNCSINDLQWSPAGDVLAVVVADQLIDGDPKRLLLLDAESGKVLREFPAASGTKSGFIGNGRWLVYGMQRDIHLVDLRSDRRRVIHEAHQHSQSGLSVSGDGKWLATCDEGRDLRIWNLATLELHAVFEGHQGKITALAFSPDNRTLLSSSYDGTVKAWSVAAGQLLMDLHRGRGGVSDMAFSADGMRLAVVEERERVRVYLMGLSGR